MKIILILTFLMGYTTPNQNGDLSMIRKLYLNAAEEESAGKKLLDMTKGYTAQEPVLFAYNGAGHMMMAKHVINPFSKMSHFNQGKKIFTAAITEDSTNPELRFLRFAVQSEVPQFLGYKENIEEDKRILISKIQDVQDKGFKKMIFNYLLSSKKLNNNERERILKKSIEFQ